MNHFYNSLTDELSAVQGLFLIAVNQWIDPLSSCLNNFSLLVVTSKLCKYFIRKYLRLELFFFNVAVFDVIKTSCLFPH